MKGFDGELGFGTRAVHAGESPNPVTGGIVTPIYQCSVYAQQYPGEFKYDYGRSMSPNFYPLEEALASIEGAKHATVVSSGVGAMSAVMALVQQGDHVIIPNDLYGGTYRLFKRFFEEKYGVQYTQLDLNNLGAVESLLKERRTRMLYIETPTNPLLTIYDLQALSALAKRYDALTVVDNTFASPYFQNPLAFGIDIVLHSCSKYIGGHSDIVGGAIMTNSAEIREQMDFARKSIGLHCDPFTMFLMRRGIKTLPLRAERQQENAFAVARFLEAHPKVERVLYPGLPSHPQHEIAKKQMRGFSGMLTAFFRMTNDEAKKLITSFKLITLAESLGACESLVEHPASMTHQKIPKEVREQHGLTDGLIRFSMGIEDTKDILADIERGLS